MNRLYLKNKRLVVSSLAIATILSIIMLVISVSTSSIKAATEPRTGDAYYNYGEALQKSLLFYKANRLGDLPDDYILPYRGDAALTDGKDVGLDLTGGWADAGDGVKFGLPMSYSAAQLGWAVYECRDAFEKTGQLDDILDEIKWTTDYFIKAHPSANVLYYDCGYGESDHSVWAPHEFLDYVTERKSKKVDPSTPGSDVAGQTSAALTIASLIFAETDADYAAECLKHAQELFTFADTYRGKYPVNGFYDSNSYLDDLAWSAIWLYIKTGDTTYLEKAKSCLPAGAVGGNHTQCWDDVSYGAAMKIAQVTKDSDYVKTVEKNLDYWQPNGGITYTPAGLAWLSQWGSLRYATTAAFLAFVWADDDSVGTASKKEIYRAFAERQINYALGDNPREGSYMVGYGKNAPEHPHHRTAHGSWMSMTTVPEFHRHILYGALVGGPDAKDGWQDDVNDYKLNEVACDYNAGFVGSLAKMYQLYGGDPLENWPQPSDFKPKEDNLTEFFTRGWIVYEGYNNLNLLFQVNNRSTWPPTMKDTLSTRYFMDLSEVIDAGYQPGDIAIKLEMSEGATLSPLKQFADNIYYFELDFTGTKFMPAEWKLCEKSVNVSIKYPKGVGDNTNDWSYQGLTDDPDYDAKSFAGKTPYIPIYDEGKLLWGQEPSGSIATTTSPTSTTTTETVTTAPAKTATPTSGTNKTATKNASTTTSAAVTTSPVATITTAKATSLASTNPTATGVSTETAGNYSISYEIKNDWGNGAGVSVTINNNSSSDINGWTLEWSFDGNQEMTNTWNGSFTQSGKTVTVKNNEYNSVIPAKRSLSIGFNCNYTGSNTKPTKVLLNGVSYIID